MVETRVICDRCKLEIRSDRVALDVTCGPARHAAATDLCRACYEAFRAWLAGPAGDDVA